MTAERSGVYKIALLGNEGVGKTALLVRFLCHRFIGEYDSNIEDCYRRTVSVDSEQVTIEILDTASRNSASQLMEGFLSTADGFVIIFSIADRKSYLAVPRYKEMIEESRDRANEDPVSVVLIGNKTDLEEHRTVSKTEGKILAGRFGWQFLEASAAEYEGVDNCFSDLIREIQARRQKMNLCQLPSNMTTNSRRPSWSNCSDTNGNASKRKKWPSLKKRVNYSNLFRKITLCGAWH